MKLSDFLRAAKIIRKYEPEAVIEMKDNKIFVSQISGNAYKNMKARDSNSLLQLGFDIEEGQERWMCFVDETS